MTYNRKNKTVPEGLYPENFALDQVDIINRVVGAGFRPYHLAHVMGLARTRIEAYRTGALEPTYSEMQFFLELHRQFVPDTTVPPNPRDMEQQMVELRAANQYLRKEVTKMDYLLRAK